MNREASSTGDVTTRRSFIRTTAAVAAAGASLATRTDVAPAAEKAGNDELRIGLVGCGGRGRGAALQALKADPNTRLVALADAFADQIETSLSLFAKAEEAAGRIDVPSSRQFFGFEAYQQLIDADVDVVLLAAPPHFRPKHFEACVRAGKHVFAEKPIAVDAAGVRRVLAASEEAETKNLSVVSGLCWRYNTRARASIERIHAGEIGRVVAVHSAYNGSRPGKPWPMRREADWGDMEWQLRNWYWFTWLSGDHIVEQAIHSLDKGAWALGDETPESAVSLGGLQARTGDELGSIFDHHAVVYEHASGLKHFHTCRQQPGCANEVATHVIGTEGVCHVEKATIRDHDGNVVWRDRSKNNVMHQAEHDEMFAALRAGTPKNNGRYMSTSTMLAILGRMASYTGQKVTWEKALASEEDFTPERYAWDVKIGVPPIAMPGVTPLV